ncbi:MAG TPA: penicillin acylase family protein [Phycisphaerales bacterium]|nr:penicillin acylase family protein [Phycisphaerales bacterium]
MKTVRTLMRVAGFAVLVLLVLAIAGVYTARWVLVLSLPRENGEVAVTGLTAPVEIASDALAIPTISADSLLDAYRAQGYVAGQNRFFQMDLMRRHAAGRVAELVGATAGLELDRKQRRLRLAKAAERVLTELSDDERRALGAYSDGVNAGLNDLRARPPEYLALRANPEPWTPRDSILVVFTMFEQLEFGSRAEKMIGIMREKLPGALVDFLTPETTRWDALVGGDDADYKPMTVPGDRTVDLRQAPESAPEQVGLRDENELTNLLATMEADHGLAVRGSNGIAIAGRHTAHGSAMLAGDMHLGLSAPNLWHRVQLEWREGDHPCRAAGVSLPGVPGLVTGSNGDIAWTFTNLTGDFRDFVLVEEDPSDSSRYLTPEGSEPFTNEVEDIVVRGGAAERLNLRSTRWGPVTDTDWKDRALVTKWSATEPGGINFRVLDLVTAKTIEEGLSIARGWRGPPQNVMLASRDGRIAWTISGWIPHRVGFDGTYPVSWAKGGVGWFGPIDESERPEVIDPPEGFVFTANQRTLPLERARLFGKNWAMPPRARRIGELVSKLEGARENDLLRIQLDTRAEVFDFYRDLLLETVAAAERDAGLARARAIVSAWNGTADADQAGFRVVVLFRAALHRRLSEALVAPCKALDREFRYSWLLSEEPMRRILEERPANMLPHGYADWPSFLRGVLAAAVREVSESRDAPPIDAPWGEANRVRMRHPFGLAVPIVARWLDMPAEPQPGHVLCVRVASATFGASQRMVVSPGHEDRAILHIPGGQSGHFLSEHYSDQQGAWLRGEATPLLAGPPVHTVTLEPIRDSQR